MTEKHELLTTDEDGFNPIGDYIALILSHASQLPTGLPDEKAFEKLLRERQEYTQAIACNGFWIEEAIDQVYYAIKLIHVLAHEMGVDIPTLLLATAEKYRLRAKTGNPKDITAERKAILEVLNAQ